MCVCVCTHAHVCVHVSEFMHMATMLTEFRRWLQIAEVKSYRLFASHPILLVGTERSSTRAKNSFGVHGDKKAAPDSLKLEVHMIESPCGCWELKLGPLEEQVLLPAEPSPQSSLLFFTICLCNFQCRVFYFLLLPHLCDSPDYPLGLVIINSSSLLMLKVFLSFPIIIVLLGIVVWVAIVFQILKDIIPNPLDS